MRTLTFLMTAKGMTKTFGTPYRDVSVTLSGGTENPPGDGMYALGELQLWGTELSLPEHDVAYPVATPEPTESDPHPLPVEVRRYFRVTVEEVPHPEERPDRG